MFIKKNITGHMNEKFYIHQKNRYTIHTCIFIPKDYLFLKETHLPTLTKLLSFEKPANIIVILP